MLSKQPQYVLLGTTNNADAMVVDIEFDPREPYLRNRVTGYRVVVELQFLPTRVVIFIEAADRAGLKLEGLPRGVIGCCPVKRILSVVGTHKRKFIIGASASFRWYYLLCLQSARRNHRQASSGPSKAGRWQHGQASPSTSLYPATPMPSASSFSLRCRWNISAIHKMPTSPHISATLNNLTRIHSPCSWTSRPHSDLSGRHRSQVLRGHSPTTPYLLFCRKRVATASSTPPWLPPWLPGTTVLFLILAFLRQRGPSSLPWQPFAPTCSTAGPFKITLLLSCLDVSDITDYTLRSCLLIFSSLLLKSLFQRCRLFLSVSFTLTSFLHLLLRLVPNIQDSFAQAGDDILVHNGLPVALGPTWEPQAHFTKRPHHEPISSSTQTAGGALTSRTAMPAYCKREKLSASTGTTARNARSMTISTLR